MVQPENETDQEEVIRQELKQLDRQIEMEMAVYSEMEYLAGKEEKI